MATTARDGRSQEKTEALDGDCLRALGHPHDHAVRQELLSALEGDDSSHPAHVCPSLRHRLEPGQDACDLPKDIPSGTSGRDAEARSLCHVFRSLRQALTDGVQILAAYRGKRGPG